MIGGARQRHGDLTQMRARSAELFACLREDGATEAEQSHYREQLVRLAEETMSQVRESGTSVSLEPMSPFERKVVHDVVAAAGLKSESEGAEPRRYVVVLPG